jgi:carboxypeptidase C (cathepsin A)
MSATDQPVQVGFSYDTVMNGTYDILTGQVIPLPEGAPLPQQNATNLVGAFPSQKAANTAIGTENSARALWQFAQVFFSEFPDYKPNDNRVSIWTESYGGKYGPATTAFFQQQNQRIANGTISSANASMIHLDTLGIINGCVDSLTMELSYPMMAYNNTYGIQAIDEDTFIQERTAWAAPGGCQELIFTCRALAAQRDPENTGMDQMTNTACVNAVNTCL